MSSSVKERFQVSQSRNISEKIASDRSQHLAHSTVDVPPVLALTIRNIPDAVSHMSAVCVMHDSTRNIRQSKLQKENRRNKRQQAIQTIHKQTK